MYYRTTLDRATVQGATFNMRGQLYRRHANTTALFSSPFYNCVLHCPAFDWSEAEGDPVGIETST